MTKEQMEQAVNLIGVACREFRINHLQMPLMALSEESGISYNRLYRYEHGRPGKTLDPLVLYLEKGMPMDAIMMAVAMAGGTNDDD